MIYTYKLSRDRIQDKFNPSIILRFDYLYIVASTLWMGVHGPLVLATKTRAQREEGDRNRSPVKLSFVSQSPLRTDITISHILPLYPIVLVTLHSFYRSCYRVDDPFPLRHCRAPLCRIQNVTIYINKILSLVTNKKQFDDI